MENFTLSSEEFENKDGRPKKDGDKNGNLFLAWADLLSKLK